MNRPRLVLVTGEPGSGKSTLGRAVAAQLRVPFLSRDEVRGGLLATAGLWTGALHDAPPRSEAVHAFVAVVEAMLRAGVSAVVEFVVLPERADAFARLCAAADVVVIVTHCADAAARAEARDRADPLLQRPGVLGALGYASIDEYLAVPERARVADGVETEFDLPTLRVRTDANYAIEAVADWVVSQPAGG